MKRLTKILLPAIMMLGATSALANTQPQSDAAQASQDTKKNP